MKVYLLYFKDDDKNWLYAYTSNKQLRDHFLLQRDYNKFISKKAKVSKDEYMQFQKNNYEDELISSLLLSTKEFNMPVVMTRIEEKNLLDESYHLDDTIDQLYLDLLSTNLLSKKDIECIRYLTKISTVDDENNLISKCNMMRLFVNLYANTFKLTGGRKQ